MSAPPVVPPRTTAASPRDRRHPLRTPPGDRHDPQLTPQYWPTATPQGFNVADDQLTRLKQLGVADVFHIPGDYAKHFTQSLEHSDGTRTIGAINELDAALKHIKGIRDRPVLFEVVIPQKDLPGQMCRRGIE